MKEMRLSMRLVAILLAACVLATGAAFVVTVYVNGMLIQAIGEPGIYADFVNGRKRADHWKIAE